MTDTNLDRAAQMAGFIDWRNVPTTASFAEKSIHAHAATLDELDAVNAELEAFKREVSDALSVYQKADGVEERSRIWDALTRFIIVKPDPLVEAMNEAWGNNFGVFMPESGDILRAALAKHGLKLERIEHE